MNILHINRNYNTSSVHQNMLAHLEQYEDTQNSVFCPVESDEQKRANSLKRTHVYISPCLSRWDSFVFDWKQHKIRLALEQNIDVQEFECIHAYTLFTDGNCAMKLSETYGIPYVAAVRNTDVNSFFKHLPYLRRRGVRIMEHASAVFFLSTSYRDRVFKNYVPKQLYEKLMKKTYIIPNGIDDFWLGNCFTEPRKVHVPLRLIYTGRINANKNIEMTIAAIEELAGRGVKAELTIVGAIEDEKIYNRILRSPYVNYHTPVPKEKLIDFYRESDIFVMPSLRESFGLGYAEAMSQGLPIIYTKGEGFDGQFPDGTVGFCVDPNSASDIAAAISKIVKNYPKFSSAAVEYAKKFNWSDIVSIYRQLYGEVIRN